MVFGQLCSFLAEEARTDKGTVVKIPETGPYFGTSFGVRIALALESFSRETALFYSPRAPITIPAGVMQADLSDPTVAALRFYEPWNLWVGTQMLQQRQQNLQTWINPTVGQPYYWVQGRDGLVYFDRTTDVVPLAGYARGLHYHPAITAESDVVKIPDSRIRLFMPYALSELTQAVVADEVGTARLQRRDSRTAQAIRTLYGEQMALLLNDDFPRGSWNHSEWGY